MGHGSLLRTKSVEQSIRDTQDPEHKLKKELGALDLMVFGVGVIIGAGIFILTGQAAARYAGPSVALSFVLAAVACGLAGLCYAEFASTVPVAGSAYTFSYATFGELIAWTIGWDLILEFTSGRRRLPRASRAISPTCSTAPPSRYRPSSPRRPPASWTCRRSSSR